MLEEACHLLPTRERVRDCVPLNGLRQDRSRSLHRKQQRMQFRKNRRRAFLPQRMAVIERQLLFTRLAINSKQRIHERDYTNAPTTDQLDMEACSAVCRPSVQRRTLDQF